MPTPPKAPKKPAAVKTASSTKAPKAGTKPKAPKLEGTDAVNDYMAKLDHPQKTEIEAVRAIVLGASPKIAERVKWNVPSFYYCEGSRDDLAAFHLRPKGYLQLVFVFHRGKMIEERGGLLEGDYTDRRLAKFHDLVDIEAKREALEWVVRRWVELTEEG